MNLNRYKTILVLHHPGSGGNHLANMLSLSPHLSNRFQHSDYATELERLYQEHPRTAAHYKDIRSPDGEGVDLSLMYDAISTSKLPYIITAHKLQDNVAEKLLAIGPVAVIKVIFSFPNLLSKRKKDNGIGIVYERHQDIIEYLNKYQFGHDHEYRLLNYMIMRSPADMLYNKLNQDLNLDLNTEICNKLHSIWYQKCFNVRQKTI
jgi:hypothetical protein